MGKCNLLTTKKQPIFLPFNVPPYSINIPPHTGVGYIVQSNIVAHHLSPYWTTLSFFTCFTDVKCVPFNILFNFRTDKSQSHGARSRAYGGCTSKTGNCELARCSSAKLHIRSLLPYHSILIKKKSWTKMSTKAANGIAFRIHWTLRICWNRNWSWLSMADLSIKSHKQIVSKN